MSSTAQQPGGGTEAVLPGDILAFWFGATRRCDASTLATLPTNWPCPERNALWWGLDEDDRPLPAAAAGAVQGATDRGFRGLT